MSDKDKLFTFIEGLKLWARLELQRQRVTDLGLTMAATERLTNFNPKYRRDRWTASNSIQNKPGGMNRSGVIPSEVGEIQSPTFILVRRAVQTGTNPRRTSRGRHRRAVDASYATANIDIGTTRRNNC
ncbi:UNVERIFIED_CONTAM: hypothetical protein Slati_0479700 [Sesamum latifolium]|uniref:Uncharacterized protein n=1 Tax=Sesamum latifolium TaxID=2727402 RepID=A0AAW2XXZ3_9LAMI